MKRVFPAFLLLSGLAVADDPKPETFVFKEVEGIEIKADVYLPAAADDVTKRPTLIWFHGGALMLNSRAGVPPQLIELSRKQGYALVSFDYRLAPETLLPEIIADVNDALKWVHEKGPELFQADPENVIVGGASAGGYLSLMTGIQEERIPKAIVSYWGFGDILGDWTTQPNPGFGKGEAPTKEEAYAGIGDKPITSTGKEDFAARGKLFYYMKRFGKWTEIVSGVDPLKEPEKLEAFCPVRKATETFPPLLLLHGTKDPDVDYGQSVQMRDVIRDLDGSVELITVEGGGHGLWGGDKAEIEAAFARSLEFIQEQFEAES
ncbi:MAG: acetyl esterase/lipase [Verrucomicrobiales bacterium]|jgi:acetyl esterase/lipase